jgi:hypothetical protein
MVESPPDVGDDRGSLALEQVNLGAQKPVAALDEVQHGGGAVVQTGLQERAGSVHAQTIRLLSLGTRCRETKVLRTLAVGHCALRRRHRRSEGGCDVTSGSMMPGRLPRIVDELGQAAVEGPTLFRSKPLGRSLAEKGMTNRCVAALEGDEAGIDELPDSSAEVPGLDRPPCQREQAHRLPGRRAERAQAGLERELQAFRRASGSGKLFDDERVAARALYDQLHRCGAELWPEAPYEQSGRVTFERFELEHGEAEPPQLLDGAGRGRVPTSDGRRETDAPREVRKRAERVSVRPVEVVEKEHTAGERPLDLGGHVGHVTVAELPAERSLQRQVRKPRQRGEGAPFEDAERSGRERFAQKSRLADPRLAEHDDRAFVVEQLPEPLELPRPPHQHRLILGGFGCLRNWAAELDRR